MLYQLIARMSSPAAAPQTWGIAGLPIGVSAKVEGLRHYLLQMTDVDGVPTQGQRKPGLLKVRLPFRRAWCPLHGVPLRFISGAALQLVHPWAFSRLRKVSA